MLLSTSIDANINQLMEGCRYFSASTPMWDGYFGDEEWREKAAKSCICWNDYMFGRGAGRGGAKHRTNNKYKYCLTASMVGDLKISGAIHGLYPGILANARLHTKSTTLDTVKGRVDELAKFFSIILDGKNDAMRSRYVSFSDFTIDDLKLGISLFPGRPEALKRALKLLSHPIVQKNISAPLQWTLLDITKSTFNWGRSPESAPISTLTDHQFLMLLDYSKRSVVGFLNGIGAPVSEKYVDVECVAGDFDSDFLRGPIVVGFLNGLISGKDASERLGVSYKKFVVAVSDVQNSAMMIVLLLTGMRVSETEHLLNGCLEERHGYWFLKSKVVKGKPRAAPPVEGWLAVPLVRDAYLILSMLCARVKGSHLFSSIHDSWSTDDGEAFTGHSLNSKFIRWIKRIDTDGLFSGHGFTVHQCRETLVAQLAAQEVGLAFISLQLKHVHSQLNSMPNLVTASYGQYRSQLLSSVSARLAVSREDALMQLYGENAKFAGPGAGEQKVRIDNFFAGLGLFGDDRVQYIKSMARRGVRLMPTSIGSCTKSFIAPDGGKLPPCAGDYNCDPNCQSHVVTERGLRVVKLRRAHALTEMEREPAQGYKEVLGNLIAKFDHMIAAAERGIT
ncbi:site-specific integrase [Delftia tsuruhatensis]|uniref:site-specific integrase n=1 Tax=Delftia tsuruhatensis TaxID=180282 RepID=UPI00244A2E8E|nr:site-specific integrase [Delftia tsuruhatensis]MDH0423538.1 site-specific integrase [Delftia tsuruhatensis]